MATERRGSVDQLKSPGNPTGEDSVAKTKSFSISKREVWEAWKVVRSNKGGPGIDDQTIEAFEQNIIGNLYKLWNRMASGSYMPKGVKRVEIPKPDGGTRPLGIPCVFDRIAQTVVKRKLEPELEQVFYDSSYGFRPNRSAKQAVMAARENCWRYAWVVDIDIKSFFDDIDHDLLMKAVHHHASDPWMLLYIDRWLKAPVVLPDGSLEQRSRGTPQGGVISPLLANLFLHYAFDHWVATCHPSIVFERYADDIICHCRTEYGARKFLVDLTARFGDCGLTLHPSKTKVVYCKDDKRPGTFEQISLPLMDRIRENYPKSGVSVVAIAQESMFTALKMAKDWEIQMPILLDQNPYAVSEEYGIRFVPTFFYVGEDGRIRDIVESFAREELKAINEKIAHLSGLEPIPFFSAEEGAPPFRPG